MVDKFQEGMKEIHWLKTLGWLAAALPPSPVDKYLLRINEAASRCVDNHANSAATELIALSPIPISEPTTPD